jgi:hypothetical protein
MNVQYFFRDCSPALHFTPTENVGMPVAIGFMYKVEWLLAGSVTYKMQTSVAKPDVSEHSDILNRDKTD